MLVDGFAWEAMLRFTLVRRYLPDSLSSNGSDDISVAGVCFGSSLRGASCGHARHKSLAYARTVAALKKKKQQLESFQRTEKFLDGVLVLAFSRHHNLYFILKPNK